MPPELARSKVQLLQACTFWQYGTDAATTEEKHDVAGNDLVALPPSAN